MNPRNEPSGLDAVIERARSMLRNNDNAGVIALLCDVLAKHEECVSGWLILGDAYSEELDYGAAVHCFRRAVALAPENDMASGSLFHALMDAGRTEETSVEAQRFLTLHDSGVSCDETLLQAYKDWVRDSDGVAAAWRKRKN